MQVGIEKVAHMSKANLVKISKAGVAAIVILGGMQHAHSAVVINEVYGGGGNAGAPYINDYVELYNNSATAALIGGHKIEYAAAANPSWTGITIPAGTSLPGNSFLLLQFGSSAAVGSPLPNPFSVVSGTNMSASNGKVRYQDGTITGDAAPTATGILDFVGFGSANAFEGAAAASAGSNTTSVSRVTLGVDTNVNSTDFAAVAPTPVPEPATIGTLSVMALGLLASRRRVRAK
jgi:uncharacterized protein